MLGFDEVAGEKLVAQARDLRPLLEADGPKNDARGRLTDEVVAALVDIDAWKMTVPRRWGGLALPLNAIARVTAELAKGCPSTAWVVGVMNSNVLVGATFPDHMQEILFAGGIPRMCAVASPGLATPVTGGFALTGRWDYASGCDLADWAALMVIIPESDPPMPAMAIVPMADVSIERTWRSAGLKGTGSDTIVTEKLFVPADRVKKLDGAVGQREPGARHFGEPCDYWPNLPVLKSKALGVLIGAAEGLLERLAERAKERPILYTSYRRRADSQVFQSVIGEAASKIGVARMVMERTTSALDQVAREQRSMSEAARAEARGHTSTAVDLVVDVLGDLMNTAGSSAFLEKNPESRYWRDINVAARHGLLVPDLGYEIRGRHLLGVEPNIAAPDWF